MEEVLCLKIKLLSFILAILCSVYAYYMWYHGIEKIGTVRTASFYYISPLFALLAGIYLLNETANFLILFGGIAVITGVYLINQDKYHETTAKSN